VTSDRFESTVNLLHLVLAKAAETLFYCRNRRRFRWWQSCKRNQHNSFCAAFRRDRFMAWNPIAKRPKQLRARVRV